MTIALEDLRALVRDEDEIVFTDEALDAAISAAGDSLLRAAGVAFQSLAAEYALTGASVKTDDLAVDIRSRGADLLKVAQSFFAEAAEADLRAVDDFVQVVEFGGRLCANGDCCVRPEGTTWPVIC